MTQYQTVTTKSSLSHLIEAALESSICSMDFETQNDETGAKSNLEDWHPSSRIVSASFTFTNDVHKGVKDTYVVPCSHPSGPWSDGRWRHILFDIGRALAHGEGTKLIAHNAKYDIRWLHSMTGVMLEQYIWWDTCMAEYLLDENQSIGLKPTAERRLGVERWDNVNLRDAESVAWDALALYNALDTIYPVDLVHSQMEEFKEEQRLARLFYFIGMPIIRTLTRIERNGLPLDTDKVAELKAESEEIIEAETDYLLAIAYGEYGMFDEDYPSVSFSPTSHFFRDFMERSELPVIATTDTGNPSWAANVLEELERQDYKLARHILDLRKHNDRLSKFFTPWLKKLAPDGRLHPTYNPMITPSDYGDPKGTVTGRLSGSNPNPQQIDRDLKICFGDEWPLVELDYSQIELRVAAWVSGDPAMLRAYRNGEDLHVAMAADITGKNPEDVTKEDRQGGKAGNFGFLYEMSEVTYQQYAKDVYGVHVTFDESREVRRTFFNRYKGLAKWHELVKNVAFKYGFVRNPIGRKRRVPHIFSSSDYYRGRAERQAINSIIQSMASDLMCLALIEIDRQLPSDEVRLVGTVHDSLLAEFRPDNLDENLQRVADIMLDPGVKRKFGVSVDVPLAIEATIGYHWNDPDATTRVYEQAVN